MIANKDMPIIPTRQVTSFCGGMGSKAFGFWRDRKHEQQSREMGSFLAFLGVAVKKLGLQLPDPQDFVDTSWNANERKAVVAYLRAGFAAEHYMGYSHCRFDCGINDADMGDADLTDGTYVWPQGFVHYVEAHGVKPPQEFVRHVLRQRHESHRP